MNSFALQVANGNSFFAGMIMVVVAFTLRLWLNKRLITLLLATAELVGISLVIVSATPMPCSTTSSANSTNSLGPHA